MRGFSVDLASETASFRDPSGQLYHATLPMPPVSTIAGIAGAALGMTFVEVWNYFKENAICVGVRCKNSEMQGRGLDLWHYQKIAGKEVRHDIVKREFLFRPAFRLYFGCKSTVILEKMKRAFENPAWALVLGRSDDLAIVKEISAISQVNEVNDPMADLSNTLVPGDQSGKFSFAWDMIQSRPIKTSLVLPVVKQLPSDFFFSGQERKGCRYETFTFLSDTHLLQPDFTTYLFGNEAIALISII